MTPSERLKSLQELGAAIKRQEQALKSNAPPLSSLQRRLIELRARELRGQTMTASEIAELRWLEKDYDEARNGDPYR